jgi:choline kinase
MENILPILIADDPQALFELCGVSLLEHLLRILQRLGFRRAFVLSTTAEIVGAEVAKRSWAREKVVVHVVSSATGPLTPKVVLEQGPSERFLIVPANIYCDARLLAALCRKNSSAALVDGNPPEFARPLIRNPCGPALVTKDFLSAFPAVPFFEQRHLG